MLSKTIQQQELPVLAKLKSQPCVTVIMPFNPKMILKHELDASLKNAYKQVKEDLYKKYSAETSDELLNKLQLMLDNLDYTTHKKSIALYVSLTVSQQYYLDIEVYEKVILDTSFEIRDVVYNKKDEQQFLLLSISNKYESLYVGNNKKLQKIVSNYIEFVQQDLHETVYNFTDSNAVKEIRLKKFLHYIDNGLPLIFKAYSLPLFVAGTEKTLEYFKHITRHQAHIAGFFQGNFDEVTETELRRLMEVQLKNWKAIKKQYLINQLKTAQDDLQLVTGIYDVWMKAKHTPKQFLIVEKNFYCPAFVTKNGQTIFRNDDDKGKIAKDAVDDVIEKVLQNGGDVEFVDELKDYNRIALIDNRNNISGA